MRLTSVKQAMSFLPMELFDWMEEIDSIEIKGDIDFKISHPGRNGVTAYFEIEIDGKITSALYELDKNFDITSSTYFQINEKNINERVNISQAEEERLLKIVQKSLRLSWKRCIRLCMDSLPEKVASCSTQCRMNNWLC